MGDEKYCNKCNKFQNVDEFEEGYITCRKCIDINRRSYNNHKERYKEEQRKRYEEDEEYRKKKLEGNKERGKKIVTCDVCNCSFCYAKLAEHRRTKKHQRNLNNVYPNQFML